MGGERAVCLLLTTLLAVVPGGDGCTHVAHVTTDGVPPSYMAAVKAEMKVSSTPSRVGGTAELLEAFAHMKKVVRGYALRGAYEHLRSIGYTHISSLQQEMDDADPTRYLSDVARRGVYVCFSYTPNDASGPLLHMRLTDLSPPRQQLSLKAWVADPDGAQISSVGYFDTNHSARVWGEMSQLLDAEGAVLHISGVASTPLTGVIYRWGGDEAPPPLKREEPAAPHPHATPPHPHGETSRPRTPPTKKEAKRSIWPSAAVTGGVAAGLATAAWVGLPASSYFPFPAGALLLETLSLVVMGRPLMGGVVRSLSAITVAILGWSSHKEGKVVVSVALLVASIALWQLNTR